MQHVPARIETDRLVLRPMAEADVAATVAGLDDLEVSRHLMRVPHPYRASDALAFLALVAERGASGEFEHFMIELVMAETVGGEAASRAARERRAIGAIGVSSLEPGRAEVGSGVAEVGSGVAEVGYWIARPFWGRGYAREALAAVVRRSFFDRPDPIEVLVARVFRSNPASMRVLEACGFLEVGATECVALSTGRTEPGLRYELRRSDLGENASPGARTEAG